MLDVHLVGVDFQVGMDFQVVMEFLLLKVLMTVVVDFQVMMVGME